MMCSKQTTLQSSVSVMVTALSGLEELSEENVASAMTLVEDTGISRILVTDAAGRILYDTRETDGAVGRYGLYTEIVQALRGYDAFYADFTDGAFRSRAASPVIYRSQTIGAVYAYEYDVEQATLLLTLRGTPFLYEGEEIGMTNFDFPDMEKVRDVESINIWNMGKRLHLPYGLRWRMIKTKSRDNARTPMQWDDSINGGFSAGTPWLSVNGNYPRINVKRQEDDPGSVLSYYRKLIAFRNGSRVLQEGDFTELYRKNGVYAYRRACDGEALTVVISLAEGERKNPASGEVVYSNYGRETAPARLAPYEALVLREVVRR